MAHKSTQVSGVNGFNRTVDPFGPVWRKTIEALLGLSRNFKIGLMVVLLLVANVGGFYLPSVVHAAPPDMYLFWDPSNPAGIPSGWSVVTGLNGYFPRAADESLVTGSFPTLVSGVTRPVTHTNFPTVAVSTPSANADSNGNGSIASYQHVHPTPTITMGTDFSPTDPSNIDIPAFINLELIEYTSGLPLTIPAGAIAMFDQVPPSGFSAFTQTNSGVSTVNRMIRIGSSVATGGSDTVSNIVSVPSLGQTTQAGVGAQGLFASTATASVTHTHPAPTALSCTSGCTSSTCTPGTYNASLAPFTCVQPSDPSYVQPLLYQATANSPTISTNLIAMFDANPGNGWQVISDFGGSWNNQFMRPATTYSNTPAGSNTRPAISISAVSGLASGTNAGNTLDLLENGSAKLAHTHTITGTSDTITNDNVPPYFNIIVAQKVSFVVTNYEWYVDPTPSTTSNNVTDPWPLGSLDLPPKTAIPSVPAPYVPPNTDAHTQLRLRVQILVSAQNVPINSIYLKLQYNKTNYGDCVTDSSGNNTSPSGWTDLANYGTTGTDWTYGSDNVTDNSQLTASGPGFTSADLELFSKSATPASNPKAAATGETMEYDWLINDSAASGASQYDFRPVQTDATGGPTTLLSYYGVTPYNALTPSAASFSTNNTCPILTTKPSTDQDLRHGEFFQTNPDYTLNGATVTQNDPDTGFEWAD